MPRDLLAGFDLAELDGLNDPVYAVDETSRIVYANPSYFAFARANGGGPDFAGTWGLGSCILDAMPAALAPYFLRMFRLCRERQEPWDHEYECSSPDRFRLYWQRVHPLRNRLGLLMVNSLVTDVAHNPDRRPAHPADPRVYTDAMGFIHQCVQCRRIKRQVESGSWDWVPDWVARQPASVTHGLCEVCLAYYYPPDLTV